MIQLKGSYIIKAGETILRKGNNIITLLGESFFLNRAINNEFTPIQYVVLGNSSTQAIKSDIALGNETCRKKCVCEVNLDTKQIVLTCSCTAKEILGTSEIGVANEEILISHDVYYAIDDEFITNDIDSVEITYTFDLNTASQRTNWKYYTSGDVGNTKKNIYYTVEENPVISVSEEVSGVSKLINGYKGLKNVDALKNTTGAYFYDNNTKTLFIRTINNDDPNNHKILIATR